MKKASIDKIINDQQETMYQVYYIQSDGSHDFLPEVRFTKKWQKNILKLLIILKTQLT